MVWIWLKNDPFLIKTAGIEHHDSVPFHHINYHLQLFIACILFLLRKVSESSFFCVLFFLQQNASTDKWRIQTTTPSQTFQIAMEAGHLFVARLKLEMKKRWRKCTLSETNSSHLKMDGWNTSFLLDGLFSGVSHIFIFIPKLGEDSHFEEHIFQRGWNHQLVQYIF